MRRLTALVSVLALSTACISDSDGLEQVEARQLDLNDTVLQGPGFVINGPGFVVNGPGFVVNGPAIVINGPGFVVNGPGFVVNGAGLTLQGIELNGPGIVINGPGIVINGPGIVINGSLFSGSVTKDGVTYELSGLDFIGAEFDLRLTTIVDGAEVIENIVLRINDIKVSEEQDDVYLYDLTYRPKNGNEWRPYCGDGEVPAVPLKNAWNVETGDRIDNPNVVTFACTNAVLAKCTLWGYKPWAKAVSCDKDSKKTPPKDQWVAKHCTEISLQDHHQACTRMARADYCGDGTPRTVDGTLIDVWDKLAPPIQTQFTDWQVEAEWNPDGAACVNFARHPEFGHPSCFLKKNGKPKVMKKCGNLKNEESLILNSFSPPVPG